MHSDFSTYICITIKGKTSNCRPGEMAEWSNAAVLKTVDCNRSGGSNPSFSAKPISNLIGFFMANIWTKKIADTLKYQLMNIISKKSRPISRVL